MPDLKKIFKYFLLVSILYILLSFLFSLPPIQKLNANLYKTWTAAFLKIAFPKALIYIDEQDENGIIHSDKVVVYFAHKAIYEQERSQAKAQGKTKFNIDVWNYTLFLHSTWTLPLVLLISLILITPVSLKQKVIALLPGIVLLLFLITIKVYIHTYFRIDEKSLGVYELSGYTKSLIVRLNDMLNTGASVIGVVIIWGLVTFRKSDWKAIWHQKTG